MVLLEFHTCSEVEPDRLQHVTVSVIDVKLSTKPYIAYSQNKHSLSKFRLKPTKSLLLAHKSVILCSFYDPLLNDKSAGRLQRRARAGFDFVKQGTFQKEAEQKRLKVGLTLLLFLAWELFLTDLLFWTERWVAALDKRILTVSKWHAASFLSPSQTRRMLGEVNQISLMSSDLVLIAMHFVMKTFRVYEFAMGEGGTEVHVRIWFILDFVSLLQLTMAERGWSRFVDALLMTFCILLKCMFSATWWTHIWQAALGEDAFKKQAKQKEEDRRDAAANAVADANLVPLGQRAPPKKPDKPVLELIPDVEWWDKGLLANSASYPDDGVEGFLDESKITIYVEHPVQLEPPAEPAPPPPMPLPLTQKERKKLRTQRWISPLLRSQLKDVAVHSRLIWHCKDFISVPKERRAKEGLPLTNCCPTDERWWSSKHVVRWQVAASKKPQAIAFLPHLSPTCSLNGLGKLLIVSKWFPADEAHDVMHCWFRHVMDPHSLLTVSCFFLK